MKTDDARKVLEEASRCWDERGSANRPQSGHYITVILQLATALREEMAKVETLDCGTDDGTCWRKGTKLCLACEHSFCVNRDAELTQARANLRRVAERVWMQCMSDDSRMDEVIDAIIAGLVAEQGGEVEDG